MGIQLHNVKKINGVSLVGSLIHKLKILAAFRDYIGHPLSELHLIVFVHEIESYKRPVNLYDISTVTNELSD
jgi:hypothetical protein